MQHDRHLTNIAIETASFIWDEDMYAKSVMETFTSYCILKRVTFILDGDRMELAITSAAYTLPHHCNHCEIDNMAVI